LLLGGDHREIPFDYVKDGVYAATTMHEQELSTDNLYADPDRDGVSENDEHIQLAEARRGHGRAIGLTHLPMTRAFARQCALFATLRFPRDAEDNSHSASFDRHCPQDASDAPFATLAGGRDNEPVITFCSWHRGPCLAFMLTRRCRSLAKKQENRHVLAPAK
jgi:hypothetical protein